MAPHGCGFSRRRPRPGQAPAAVPQPGAAAHRPQDHRQRPLHGQLSLESLCRRSGNLMCVTLTCTRSALARVQALSARIRSLSTRIISMEVTFERAAAITYASAEAKLLTRAPNSLSTTLDTRLTLLVARAVRQGSPGLTPTALRHRLDLPLD